MPLGHGHSTTSERGEAKRRYEQEEKEEEEEEEQEEEEEEEDEEGSEKRDTQMVYSCARHLSLPGLS